MGKIDIKQESSTPSNPPTTYSRIYPKTDGLWYGLTPAGVETALGPVTFAAPVDIGTANAEGAASTVARSNHVHNHGAQTVGTLHAVATTSVNGFMVSTDKTKLDHSIFGFISYSNTSNLSTTQNNTGYTAVTIDTDNGSFANSLLTKSSATEIRTDFAGYVRISFKAMIQNSSTNDKPARIIILKNGTAVAHTQNRCMGKTNAERYSGSAGSFILACAVNDVFSLGYSNAEAITETQEIDAGNATLTVSAIYKT